MHLFQISFPLVLSILVTIRSFYLFADTYVTVSRPPVHWCCNSGQSLGKTDVLLLTAWTSSSSSSSLLYFNAPGCKEPRAKNWSYCYQYCYFCLLLLLLLLLSCACCCAGVGADIWWFSLRRQSQFISSNDGHSNSTQRESVLTDGPPLTLCRLQSIACSSTHYRLVTAGQWWWSCGGSDPLTFWQCGGPLSLLLHLYHSRLVISGQWRWSRGGSQGSDPLTFWRCGGPLPLLVLHLYHYRLVT